LTLWIADPADLRATLNAYFAGLNEERFADVTALFAVDAQLRAPGTAPIRGASDLERYFRAALRPYPQHRDEATRIIICGRTATVEIHFNGSLASGFPIEFDAVDVFDFDGDGRIAALSSWYDSHAVRSLLRQARAAQATPGR
jgi:hypothetical protein